MKQFLFGSGFLMLTLAIVACDEQSTTAAAEAPNSSGTVPTISSSSEIAFSSSSLIASSSSNISQSMPACKVESASGFGTDSYCIVLADGSMTDKKCSSVKVTAPVVSIQYRPTGCDNSQGSYKYCTFDEGIVYIYKSSISTDCTPYYTHLKETM